MFTKFPKSMLRDLGVVSSPSGAGSLTALLHTANTMIAVASTFKYFRGRLPEILKMKLANRQH